MGFLLSVIEKTAADDHPLANLAHCVNRKQKHLSCSACMDICPKGVYDRTQKTPPDWQKCQNCDLCVTACATRCIAPSPTNAKRHLLLAQKQGDVVLSCRRAEKKQGHLEECLAQIPWEFMAYLALGGHLTLNTKACQSCPHEDCRELLNSQIEKLRRFLGAANAEKHLRIAREEDADAPQADVDRRDFFRSLAAGGKKTTALVISEMTGGKIDAMVYRRLLARQVKEIAAQDKAFSCVMTLPWIEKKCYGCGICALLCPNQALEIGEEKDGVRTVYITPHKCTGCGVCKVVCRDGCIEELCAAKLPHLDRLILAKVASKSCEGCGRAMPADREEDLCVICRQKKKK